MLKRSWRRNTLLFDLPVGQRLTLGFLAAALLAAMVAGVIGMQRQTSLHNQSAFYQKLLAAKTNLIVGSSVLEMMNSRMHDLLEAVSNGPVLSQETLTDDEQTLQNLTNRYNDLLNTYISQDLLQSDQVGLLQEANVNPQVVEQQQSILVHSAQRSWQIYRVSQEQMIATIKAGDVAQANVLERLQGEPDNADAQSAAHALIQLMERLSHSVLNATNVEEQYQFTITWIGILVTVIGIALVGLFISNTLVYRLKQLRKVTQAVEEGQVPEHVKVVGRDEIADISSSVNAMLAIIASEEEIITASELKEQFLASVSHELRNPLSEVYGWLEILHAYQGKIDEDTQRKFLNRAIDGCQELMLLINNILDATQVSKQTKVPQLEDVPVRHMIQTVIDHLNPREAEHYHLHVDLSEDLCVRADPQYMRQVLRNLLSNAMKYSPKGSSITIAARRYEGVEERGVECSGQVCISVKDTGPGIPASELGRLFQKFVRLQRDKTSGVRGTGLGLYICKQLVESMYGRIWVESSGVVGEGSCFSFTLPEVVERRVECEGEGVEASSVRG